MNRNVPIRTYERKKCRNMIIPLTNLDVQTLNNTSNENRVLLKNKFNAIENKENHENSMYYDPFDTTFDRLVKNARLPVRTNKSQNSIKSYNGTDKSSSWNNSKAEVIFKETTHEHTDLSDINMKPILMRKGRKPKKPTKQSIKKTIINKDKSLLSLSIGKRKKKHKLCKVRNIKKATSNISNIDPVCLNVETDVSEIRDDQNNYTKVKQGKSNKKYASRRNERNNDVANISKSIENMYIKSCSVVLNKFDILKWNNKVDKCNYQVPKEIQESTLVRHEPVKQYEITKINDTNLNSNSRNMKHCCVKIEQLKITSNIKPLRKRNENVISSTPIGRPVRPLLHLIPLSPIFVTQSSHTVTNVHNKDVISLISKELNVDVDRKCDAIERNTSNKEIKSLSTNASNINKCNLNHSEELGKQSTDSLTELNSVESNVQNQQEHLTETEKVETGKNILLDVVSPLVQEHMAPIVVNRKCHLNFSVDIEGSRSLFGDSKESVQTSIANDNTADSIKVVSINNLTLDKTNEELNIELNNNTHLNSVKLEEEIISNVITTANVTFDKVKEEPCEILAAIKSPILNVAFDNAGPELRIERIDNEINNVTNVDKARDSVLNKRSSIFNKSDTLCISNSTVSSDKNCSAIESCIVLKQLQDPVRITKRRKQYHKWDLDLASISEDGDNNTDSNVDQMCLNRASKSKRGKISQKGIQFLENIAETSIGSIYTDIENPIYLKPGKSWARSLSILNSIQNEFNLDKLSCGKGKKWRHSVRDILNMQKQGIIQSCVKKNENDKDLHASNEVINKSDHELVNDKGRTCDSTSIGRLSRRISVRVVPIHKTVKSIDDASFLEVYGIVPVKNKRFTILSNPRKSSVCNIQNDIIDGQFLEDHSVSTAREVILQRCMQKDYIPFSTYFSDLYLEHCQKIGEGVYGEVFLYEHENKKSVIKIIPIEGTECVNGEPQKKFHEILSEIVIAMELHNLRFNAKYNTDGFVEVKNINCIKGKYPKKLVELWNIYDEEKQSDNDCPSMFNDDQLYIILELGHGGQDLEAFVFHTAEEAYTLFIQAALALAVAEKAVEFEHRDLHWGNILISSTNDSDVSYKLGQKQIKVASKGVKVSIIDFTLSRVTYQGCSVFNDLASDPSLFTAQGEYQFEIYRLMRDKISNDWQNFEPYTNILWLHYTLDKMITAVRYRKKNLKMHKNGILKLKDLKNEVLMYNSVFDFVTNCDNISSMLVND